MISPELHSDLFIIWMVLSVIAFIALMVWTLWPSHRRKLESYADIPLREDSLNDNSKEAR
ncbi:MAG TPA: cbb3-type cytochrome c oxidase subunit 3 [Dongiaceae bacterium]|jgi:FtsZ-interacting cell division protein ZipA